MPEPVPQPATVITDRTGLIAEININESSPAPIDRNLLAVSIGGGAIGFLTPRAGVRFDLRHVRSTSSGQNKSCQLEIKVKIAKAATH